MSVIDFVLYFLILLFFVIYLFILNILTLFLSSEKLSAMVVICHKAEYSRCNLVDCG
jgi:hypothetical protein